jgi:hypothetical protein
MASPNNINPNENQIEHSSWNPFVPTERDINRTEELAKKDPVMAGFLTFLLLPAAMIYLNRGVNNLKILAYVFVAAFFVAFGTYNSKNRESEADVLCNIVGFAGSIAAIIENSRSVTLARKRLASRNET